MSWWFRSAGAPPRAGQQSRAPDAAPAVRSKALAQFMDVIGARGAAEVVDVGPAVGSNITFLGERVACKIHVEDLYADLDRHAREATVDRLPEILGGRFAHAAESIDAVLGWDVFDYLDRAAAGVLAAEVVRMLRPGGVLLAFFAGSQPREPGYTRYVIEDETHIRYESSPGLGSRGPALANRDILALFGALDVEASVILPSGVREYLFRKPAR